MKQAAALATPIATLGAVQMLAASQTTPWSTIGGDFLDVQFWLTVFIIALAGAFGGASSGHAAMGLGVTSGAAAPAMIRLMRKQLLSAADALSTLRGNGPLSSQHSYKSNRRSLQWDYY